MTFEDKDYFIHPSATVINTNIGKNVKIWKDVIVKNSTLQDNCVIGDFSQIEDSTISENTHIQRNSNLFNIIFGRYSYAGKNLTAWHAVLGSFCSISWNVSIGGANHDYRKVTSHAFLYSNQFNLNSGIIGYDRFSNNCIIGSDVWIGANAFIGRDINIGDGAVIGAGAIVTKDVPAYAIVVGVPARIRGYRFSESVINELIEIKWWNLPSEIIKNNFDLFNSYPSEDILEKLHLLVELYAKK